MDSNPDPRIEACKAERMFLRSELHDLKNCQVTFLTYSVTATGLLFGLLAKSGDPPLASGAVPLFPLVVLVPFWWIFFDKATTVSRIVGYTRILEDCIAGRRNPDTLPGWESALALQRADDKWPTRASGFTQPPKLRSALRQLSLRTPNKYWMLAYYTFGGLSVLCLLLSMAHGKWHILAGGPWWWWAAVLGTLASLGFTFGRIWSLIFGSNSYEYWYRYWNDLISGTESNEGTKGSA